MTLPAGREEPAVDVDYPEHNTRIFPLYACDIASLTYKAATSDVIVKLPCMEGTR
jgi:hypothetical protein